MFKSVAHRLQLALFFALLACGPKPTPAPIGAVAPGTEVPLGPLPRSVVPVLYDLELNLDPAQSRYAGHVDIALQVQRPTQVIWMHGQSLDVTKATLRGPDGRKVTVTYTQVSDDGVVQVVGDEPFKAGLNTLSLSFEAPFSTNLNGLYRVVSDGTPYLFTQFEPISARRAFPCFDEPAFKTPFQVTLNVPEALMAVSNTMPMGEQRTGDGTKKLLFNSTHALPTYLLAVAVGPFESYETTLAPNVVRPDPLTVRGVATQGQGERLKFAVKHTGDLVQSLERYFGGPYPFPKLDIIAVPDFAAGAMENAGAITFRDWLILLDPDHVNQQQLRSFAYVVAHELAHQWFGDDVTMPWWNDLWLNEAFATWMGYKIANEWDPNLRLDLQYAAGAHDAMRVDAFAHARKIRQPCETHDDIHNAFDAITYQKGGGVLGMFERYVGVDAFQAGVRNHVRAHHFANADGAQFLRSLEDGAQKPGLAQDFGTFLDQPGVPDIQVAIDCNGAQGSMVLTQQRYKPVGSTVDANATWRIPVCYKAGKPKGEPTRSCALFTESTQQVALEHCPTWLMPDADGAGYYRWGLSKVHLEALLQKAQLTPAEELSIGSNLSASFAAATMRGDEVLVALSKLAQANAYQVAIEPLGVFDFVYKEILQDNTRPKARAWFQSLYGKRLQKLGLKPQPGESSEQALLRRHLLQFSAERLREPELNKVLQAAGENFLGYGYDGQLHADAVNTDILDIALTAAANARGEGYTEMLISALRRNKDANLRRQMVAALARVTEPRSAKRVRELTLEPLLRVNEMESVLAAQIRDTALRDDAWTWFKNNFDALKARLPAEHLGNLPSLTGGFCSEAARDDVEAFFSPKVKSLPGAPRSLAQALEAIELCRAQVQAQSDSVQAMFAK